MKRDKRNCYPHDLFRLVKNTTRTKRKRLLSKTERKSPIFENKHGSKYQVHGTIEVHQRTFGPEPFLLSKEIFMIGLQGMLNCVSMNYLKIPKYLFLLLWKLDLQVEKSNWQFGLLYKYPTFRKALGIINISFRNIAPTALKIVLWRRKKTKQNKTSFKPLFYT